MIGICASLVQARWSAWDVQAHLTPRSYVDAVQRAGGLAVLLPSDAAGAQAPDDLLDHLDGLILAGGADVSPSCYGAEPHERTEPAPLEQDAFEVALTRRAVERDLPVLGICRGMQVLNVAHGGTLLQHLPDTVGHEDHRRVLGTFDGADHDVRLADGSLAARAAGEAEHPTKSHHHQGVDRLGDGLRATGWALQDELPEAVERPDRSFVLGVQWHPEADEQSRIIGALVDAAAARVAAASRAA